MQLVTFYQYCHDSVERTICKLLEKVYTTGKNALVLLENSEQVAMLDSMIWTYATMSFLPHGSPQMPESEWKKQPIFLTDTLHNPNDAKIVVTAQGNIIDESETYERCIDLVSESDVDRAKERMETYKNRGCQVTWWQQDLKGSWTKSE